MVIIGFPGGSVVKNLPTNVTDASSISAGDSGLIPGWEHPLEKGMATHSGILAWRMSWTENYREPQRATDHGVARESDIAIFKLGC